MSTIWKPRPPSFPSDDKIPWTAAEVNEFDDMQDLNIRPDGGRTLSQSEDDIELDVIQKSKLFRARDSVFVRRKQRNSVVSTSFGSDEESDTHSERNVKFQSIHLSPNHGVENEAFEMDEEVVLRRKTITPDNSYNANHDFNLDPFEEQEELKAWDVFKTIPPPDDDETLDGVWVEFFIKCLKIFVYFLTFVVILGSAVISKSLILLMISMTRVNRKIPICNDPIFDIDPKIDIDKRYNAVYGEQDSVRIAWVWCLFFAVIAPDVFAFGRSFRICYFKKYQAPKLETFITVFSFETLHSIGLSLLVFLILPTIDAIRGSMMTNTMCLIPGVLLLLKQNESNKQSNNNQRNSLKQKAEKNNGIAMTLATILQIIAIILWPIIEYYENNPKSWCLPVSLILISMNWWENFLNRSSRNAIVKRLMLSKKDLAESRYFTYVLISIWKIIVIFVSMNAIIYFNDSKDAVETLYKAFTDGFTNDTIQIKRDNWEHQDIDRLMTIKDPLIPVWILLIQITATYFCYAFAKFTCKIHIQTISFAIPVHLVVPVTVSFLWIMVEVSDQDICKLSNFFHGFQYMFWYTKDKNNFDYYNDWMNSTTTVIWAFSLISQILITIHIWTATSARLASTEELFINPMYNSVLIDQSLAMNRRRFNLREEQIQEDEENAKTGDEDINGNLYESVNETSSYPEPLKIHEEDNIIRIFVCATMWHENKEEMIQMLKAVIRLDEDQFNKKMAQEFFAITDYYEIEFNIYFDDAYDQGDPNVEDDRKINRFVKQLIETMDEAASNVHGTVVQLKKPNIVPTPYGGKLEWTLPGQNKLVAHLKDKLLIRHRKRWSQCMYMYYLLGHRIAELPIDDNRKETIAMNTFILALDGDINFRPQSLHLVVDLMKKNRKLGAACGRIHPIGTGPMVWYQKFEYAIGHWLQKATEHVFGCVLCSPGCFSLFRARAVMDDSVMNKYTTKPTEALHYVQYDQGEDRWLCTLLLQQGWRIEYCAASDSYTHAPEGFGEFYTQRRRWAPSTMANIMDLLGDYKHTVERNTDISKLYILYQGMLMLGTVLSPGTIFLMVVGAMNTVLNLDSKYSLAINIVPILLFSIVCLVAKKNDHIIFVAMILSTIYALLMLAVLVGTAIDIKDQGFLTPNSIFFLGMMASFIVAAIIHPQEFGCVIPLLLYMLLIPSMYLLLTIYSVTNMHIVTWGTREVKATLTAKEMAAQAEAARLEEEAKKNKKSMFGFLNMSKHGSKSGIFTCLCCSNAKSDEESNNLLEIKDQLNKVYENIDIIKSNVDQKRRSSIYRRKSFGVRDQTAVHLSVTQEEEEEDMESISETTSLMDTYHKQSSQTEEAINDPNRPRWARDGTFIGFPYVELSPNELSFWNVFIPKYLLPLDENPQEQKRIANDLKELRNRAVFAFGIINVVFILFVFLLQMHKDVFGIKLISGIKKMNHTYNEEKDIFEDVPIYSYTIMDPIGLVLVVFFGAILIIQMIGMFMHRFGTLAHLLAFTPIDFFDRGTPNLGDTSSDNMNRSAVRIARKIQKQGVSELTEQDKKTTDPIKRRQSVFARPQAAQPLDLHDAFRLRMNSIKPNDQSIPTMQGMGRKSIGQVIVDRRKTIDWGRLPTGGDILQRVHSQQDSTRTPSVSHSITSFNPRPKSITFKMDEPTLQPVRRPSDLRVNLNKPLNSSTNSPIDQPRIMITPMTPPVNEGLPTGQHTVGYFNLRQQNMAEDMSNNIIRNSLNEMKIPEENEDQVSSDYQIPGPSSSPEFTSGQSSDRKNSNESESHSSVSSNIDFNFDAYVESDSSGDFPITTQFPATTIQISSPTFNRKRSSETSEEVSTRL